MPSLAPATPQIWRYAATGARGGLSISKNAAWLCVGFPLSADRTLHSFLRFALLIVLPYFVPSPALLLVEEPHLACPGYVITSAVLLPTTDALVDWVIRDASPQRKAQFE